MSVESSRTIQVEFSGDVSTQVIQSALDNELAFGQIDILNLIPGDNIITIPTGNGFLATGLTIIPPAGNTVLVALKGDPADIGVAIHPTDPTSLGLHSTVTILLLTSADTVTGMRLVWS